MAERIKLYSEIPKALVETVEPISTLDPNCTRCPLHETASIRCLPASGGAEDIGDLLIVGEGPGPDENSVGQAFVGATGNYLRGLLAQNWNGRYVLDNGTRCYPGRGANKVELNEKHTEACRGYLAQTLLEVKPRRVLALGAWAAQAIFGRVVPPFSTRKGYGWLANNGDPVPVFFLIHPAAGLRNRFVKQWFEEDFKWALTANLPFPPWGATACVVTTAEDAQQACAELRLSDWFAFDVETAGEMYSPDFRVLSLAAASYGGTTPWVWDGAALGNPETFEPLKALLMDPSVKKVGQNVKYDVNSIKCAYGFWVEGIHGDTRLWRKLMEPEAEANLDAMGELVGLGGHKNEAEFHIQEVITKFKRQQAALKRKATKAMQPPKLKEDDQQASLDLEFFLRSQEPAVESELRLGADPRSVVYSLIPREILLRYNARDSVTTAELGALLEARLSREPNLERIWNRIVHPASIAITRVENWGVPASLDAIRSFRDTLTIKLADVKTRLDAYGDVNWGSTQQVRALLYDKLGLPVPHETDSGLPSTDEGALAALKPHHPVAADLLAYRFLTKMDGTYATGMIPHVRADGRIHGSINLDGARSGRTSMSDPNLQNIPRADDSPEGKMARDCIVAPPGYILVQADFSQLELRIAAMLSGDEEMAEVFRSGVDYHLRTAQMISYVWGKKPEEVGKPERSGAKAFNFGILYGMSDEGIANRAGIPVDQASQIREAIFGKFRKLKAWINQSLYEATQTGVAWTWWDGQRARRRPLWRIGDTGHDDYSKLQKSKAEHSAWNTPVQGTASEFCIASLVKVVDLIVNHGLPAELVLPVHDSLLLVVPEKDAMPVAHEVHGVMTGFNSNGVPLEADVEMGPAWGSLQKVKLAA